MSVSWWVYIFCVGVWGVKSDVERTRTISQFDWGEGRSSLLNVSNSKPNILLIMADDMGWGDMGANWNTTRVTPCLDALAQEGLRFVDFHSGSSSCGPSRAALLTGRLGLRTGVTMNFRSAAVGGLPATETTIATMLRGVGYRTAMLGKWHLGVRAGFHPLDHGFESYLGVPFSTDMACADPPGANFPACPACPAGNPSPECQSRVPGCFPDLALPLLDGRRVVDQPVQLQGLATRFAQFGTNFMNQNSSAPFFLYAALSHVHVPHAPTEGPEEDPFAAALAEMDWLVGRLATAARAADATSGRDTLIWFTSDNGPWEVKCSMAGSAGPFEGRWQRSAEGGGGGTASKATVWEGGHRVPTLVHWPSRVRGGRVSRALGSALDVLPTLAAVAGAALPSSRALDGRDLSPLLLRDAPADELEESEERVLFHPNSGATGAPGAIGAVRIGRLKAVYYSGGLETCGGAKGPAQKHDPPLVFDVEADPAEASPLCDADAEPVRRAAAAALASLAASIENDTTSHADYSLNRAARPCCNDASPICRCPWNEPLHSSAINRDSVGREAGDSFV